MHVAAEAEQFSGEIDDFGPLEKEQKKAIRKGLKVMCRECQMGMAAAQLTLTDAGLGWASPTRTGPASASASTTCSALPEEFTEGISAVPRRARRVRVFPLGRAGHGQDVAPVAAEVSAQHAGQPPGHLQRLARARTTR